MKLRVGKCNCTDCYFNKTGSTCSKEFTDFGLNYECRDYVPYREVSVDHKGFIVILRNGD